MAVDEPLFWLYDGAGVIDDRTRREGPSRSRLSTIEHDPTFAIRILGDIAITALSAATNDSTMAALAMIARPKRGTRFPRIWQLPGSRIRTLDGPLGLEAVEESTAEGEGRDLAL